MSRRRLSTKLTREIGPPYVPLGDYFYLIRVVAHNDKIDKYFFAVIFVVYNRKILREIDI